MTDDDQHPPHDALERLRAANPLPEPTSDPSAPRSRQTLETILMSTTDTPTGTTTGDPTGTTDAAAGARSARSAASALRRNPMWLAAAAVVLLVAGVVGAVTLAGDDSGDVGTDDGPGEVAGPTIPEDPAGSEGPTPGPVPGPGGSDDGTSLSSCVETYSPETLPNREYAFDGTVESVDGDAMTFAVNEWFAGTPDQTASATVTLDHQGLVGMLFSPQGPALEPGTRVLSAGDGGFVWSCGFTQQHTPELADEWRTALAG